MTADSPARTPDPMVATNRSSAHGVVVTGDKVTTRITEVSFCAMPLDDFEASSWTITVAWRGPGDRYAVVDRSGQCLSSSGKWHYESLPSGRTDRFKKHHRFPYDEACELAARWAPKVRCNGIAAAEVPIWRAAMASGMTRAQALDAVADASPAFRRWRDGLRRAQREAS